MMSICYLKVSSCITSGRKLVTNRYVFATDPSISQAGLSSRSRESGFRGCGSITNKCKKCYMALFCLCRQNTFECTRDNHITKRNQDHIVCPEFEPLHLTRSKKLLLIKATGLFQFYAEKYPHLCRQLTACCIM